jgi:hypothetical protein
MTWNGWSKSGFQDEDEDEDMQKYQSDVKNTN